MSSRKSYVQKTSQKNGHVRVLTMVTGAQEYNKHRTTSLIYHASKILPEMTRRRISNLRRTGHASAWGCAWRRNIWSLNHIMPTYNLWSLNEKWRKTLAFLLWLQSIFDAARNPQVWKTLTECGFPQHLILMQTIWEESEYCEDWQWWHSHIQVTTIDMLYQYSL